jgi:DNA polymerase III psi subunit
MSNNEYLKYLFQDDIYLIKEPDGIDQSETKPLSTSDLHEETEEKRKPTSILIVADILYEEEKSLLGKVLSAVGIKMDQVTMTSTIEATKYIPEICITFDDHQSEFDCYEVLVTNNRKYLYSKSLNTLNSNIEDKKALWTSLKKMFEIG